MTKVALGICLERQRKLLQQLSVIQGELCEVAAALEELTASTESASHSSEPSSADGKPKEETSRASASSSGASRPAVPSRFGAGGKKLYIVCEGNTKEARGWYPDYNSYASAVIDPERKERWQGPGDIPFYKGSVSLAVNTIESAWKYWEEHLGKDTVPVFH